MSDIFENKGALAATIVVAASDSLNKGAANYVTSGAADDVEINAALAACNGGEVKLLEGNYTTVANIIVPADCKLSGAGFGTVITANHASITQAIVLNDRSTLSNLKVILAAGCGTAGARPNVVYATGETQIWVEDVWVVGDQSVVYDASPDRQNGILWDAVTHSKIINCKVDTAETYGIRITNSSNYNTVTGNSVNNSLFHGIVLGISSHNTVNGNTIVDAGYSGIMLGTGSNSNTIAGNECYSNDKNGIYLNASLNNTITGNTCISNVEQGIYFYNGSNNNTITGNTCQGNSENGIYLYGADGACVNNTITGNTVADNTLHGIYIHTSNENVITGNQCDDNGTGANDHGISVYRSSYCSLTGNVCNNNSDNGIQVIGDGTTNADYNAIGSNTCYNNGNDGIRIGGGVNAVKNIVLGNQLTGNAGAALSDGGTNSNLGHNQVI